MQRLPSFSELWTLIKKATSAWLDDYAPSMGAALSYYTVFSLAPMLLIVIAVAGLVFGREAAQGALFEQLSGMMGTDAAKAVEGMLASVDKPSQGIVATLAGVAILLVGATTVFGELQDSLNRIWRVPKQDGPTGIWGLIRTRLLSFGMILGIAFLLMVSLVVSTGVSALGKWWSPIFGGWEWLAVAVTFLFGLAVTAVGFALIYRYMPRAHVKWPDVWIGAFVTALLFSVGRFLIGLYIGKSSVASGFGAAGSIVVVFVWVYYSAQIFLLGAEFTWAYATSLGSMKAVAQPEEPEEPAQPAQPAQQAQSQSAMPTQHASDLDLAQRAQSARPIHANDRQDRGLIAGVMGGFVVGVAARYIAPWALKRLTRR